MKCPDTYKNFKRQPNINEKAIVVEYVKSFFKEGHDMVIVDTLKRMKGGISLTFW